MKKNIFICILVITIFACKKNEPTEETLGEISIELQNNKVKFHLEKVHFQTDSIFINFETETLYDCNQYKLNAAIQQSDNNINFLLGNIYRDGGFCIWGQFPATYQYKSRALKNGNYTLSVKKGTNLYKGLLSVTSTEYKFNWEHDDVMQINPKLMIK